MEWKGHSCLIAVSLVLTWQHLEINKLKHKTVLSCRSVAPTFLRWVVNLTKRNLCAWVEMRGIDPTRSALPWARDPFGVLPAAILPLKMWWCAGSLEVTCRIKLSRGTLEPRTEQVLEGILVLVSTETGGGWGLGLLWVCFCAWESCLIHAAGVFVVGFRDVSYWLHFSLSKVLLNSDLGNEEVGFIPVFMK